MSIQTNIQKAVKKLGGPVATARAVGAPSYQAVQSWLEQGQVPVRYCHSLEKLSGMPRTKFRKDAKMVWPELFESA